ncbi:MAG: transketolase family protein [Proteobacteria bacterium]|nr:transketolase family protein [Pseudomonadota bacterium]
MGSAGRGAESGSSAMSAPAYGKVMGLDEQGGPRPTMDAPFGVALTELGTSRPNIIGLTADLGKYTDIHPFRDAHPNRFFNVGMAEQNLVAIAAGLARTGFVPFATTYGVFATRRAYDFVAIACAHARANVKIIAGLPGLTTGYGGTHQATEDTGLMCMVPDLVVIDPCDATETMAATRAIADYQGPVYMRLLRGKVPIVFESTCNFEIGKARLLLSGTDVGIVSTGLMTERALDAAMQLRKKGLSVGVLHVPTLKPLDTTAITEFASSVRSVVSAENHVVRGGLATMIAETLFRARLQVPLKSVGLPDRFLECGVVAVLQERYGLSTDRLMAEVESAAR